MSQAFNSDDESQLSSIPPSTIETASVTDLRDNRSVFEPSLAVKSSVSILLERLQRATQKRTRTQAQLSITEVIFYSI